MKIESNKKVTELDGFYIQHSDDVLAERPERVGKTVVQWNDLLPAFSSNCHKWRITIEKVN